jgi:alpha-glucan phosphorylase-like protein
MGKAMIAEWMQFLRRPELRDKVIFLEDYDMKTAEEMVRGVDAWVNTPRPPFEACGTSGMKVLANGGLNVSELDGWWAEAYKPEVGWALGDGSRTDEQDATELYELLEREVVPEFYDRDVSVLRPRHRRVSRTHRRWCPAGKEALFMERRIALALAADPFRRAGDFGRVGWFPLPSCRLSRRGGTG